MTINERIAELRKELGLTQTAFGQRIGVSRDTIANLEGGRSSISDLQKTAICREFKVSRDWLENGEGEMMLLPVDEDYEMMTKFLEYGKEHAAAEALKAIFLMYNMLDDGQRKLLDDMIHQAATKKDPE